MITVPVIFETIDTKDKGVMNVSFSLNRNAYNVWTARLRDYETVERMYLRNSKGEFSILGLLADAFLYEVRNGFTYLDRTAYKWNLESGGAFYKILSHSGQNVSNKHINNEIGIWAGIHTKEDVHARSSDSLSGRTHKLDHFTERMQTLQHNSELSSTDFIKWLEEWVEVID